MQVKIFLASHQNLKSKYFYLFRINLIKKIQYYFTKFIILNGNLF